MLPLPTASDAPAPSAAPAGRVRPTSSGGFSSFWMAGYEGADHVNGSGTSLGIAQLTEHSARAGDDYALLHDFGISSVRETVGWRVVERQGQFDFSSLQSRIDAAHALGIQIAWTFCHYGWPDDADIFDDSWIARFADFSFRTTEFLAAQGQRAPVCTPINEISFTAWAVCETGLIHPHRGDRAHEAYAVKRRLVRAAMAGCDAIWSVAPAATILTVDPLIHTVAPADQPELAQGAARLRSFQFQSWDLLAGAIEPELGGHPRYIGVLGVNYYHDNQWEYHTGKRLHWHLADPRRVALSELLEETYGRYGLPIVLAETSHVGVGRGRWIREVAAEVARALANGIPIQGVCVYPIIDRPDWENLDHWHNSGLWDLLPTSQGLERRLCEPYARDLRAAQSALGDALRTFPLHSSSQPTRSQSMSSLVVFSHLRWDFVFQRPQHLLTRLARQRKVFFVEEPVFDAGSEFMEVSHPCTNVTVLRPHTSVHAPGFHEDQIATVQALLTEALAGLCHGDYCAWFYTPMALPLLASISPRAVIYDCMDELSAFSQAPAMLRQREQALMQSADIVFTGGPSLFEAKRHLHASVYCFPSAVDAEHFSRGRDRSAAHASLAPLPYPRLGFFGVIDERLDHSLLRALAEARPDWQLCMVGPVVKIDPAILPRLPNIHYYGQQSYADLPAFLAGWDVCLMPFALNESTRFISPTKTLEYMAAERPIVSTAIADVVSLYGDLVPIAHSPAEFIEACEKALGEMVPDRTLRAMRMRERVASLSWEATVNRMEQLISDTVASREEIVELSGSAETVRANEAIRVPMP